MRSRSASASASGSRSASFPPARAIVGRPPPLPPTSTAAPLTTSPALTLRRDGLVEVGHELHASVLDRAEHDGRRRVPLLDAVGQLEQRVAREPVDLLHDDADAVSLDHAGLGVGARRRRGARALQVTAQLLDLAADVVELARARVQVRPGLTGGDRLDPARPRADGALGEDREGSDLGGRPDVRAAAELGRVAGYLDDADDVAVLLAEEHHRAEVARLVDRRLERDDAVVLEDLLVHPLLDVVALLRCERRGRA